MTFVSLLFAIGLSDVFVSLHKLVRIRKRITWWWVPIAWAVIISIWFIGLWFFIFSHVDSNLTNSFAGFLVFILPIIFMLLNCFAVLPDHPEPGLNLKEWYYEQKKYIFSLFLGLLLSQGFIIVIQLEAPSILKLIFREEILPLIVSIILVIVLILSNRKWVQIATVIFFIVITIAILSTS